jgi:hypothetical protein
MNYRDLQNISNLSQQILVEGANEEHNVLNRWPYTSPYLQESYMDVYGLDEKIATPPSRYDTRKELDAKSRRLRRSRDFYTYGGENQDPDERTISTSKGEGGITKNPKKLRKQKAMGEFGEQVDLYDIILSHLLDEGYAETQEQAEVIMVNMSEDWRESIVEGMGGAKNQDDYEKREKERQEVRDEHLRKYKSGELPFQKQKKADQAQKFLKKHPKK